MAERHVEQGVNVCVSAFFVAGVFPALWPLCTVD